MTAMTALNHAFSTTMLISEAYSFGHNETRSSPSRSSPPSSTTIKASRTGCYSGKGTTVTTKHQFREWRLQGSATRERRRKYLRRGSQTPSMLRHQVVLASFKETTPRTAATTTTTSYSPSALSHQEECELH
jgi:hypothetical protein